MIRHGWISTHADVSQKRQCVLAGVSRTTVYVKRKAVFFVEADEVLKRLIDEEYTPHPFYGSRKMVVYLVLRVRRARIRPWCHTSQHALALLRDIGMGADPATANHGRLIPDFF
jgi:hypothetical protein